MAFGYKRQLNLLSIALITGGVSGLILGNLLIRILCIGLLVFGILIFVLNLSGFIFPPILKFVFKNLFGKNVDNW